MRIVLLKGVDSPEHDGERGFIFYTNLESRKAVELTVHPVAAACFYWKSMGRQLRIEGYVKQVEPEEADHYFACRPRGSQNRCLGLTTVEILESRSVLMAQVKAVEAHHAGRSIPRPDFWSDFVSCL